LVSPFETRNATAIWWRFFKNSCRHTAVVPPFDNTAPCNDCTMDEWCSRESIPVRLFLSPYELTPTYRNINNKFSVKYFLNLVLVDEEDRRYFKQQEITVYRLSENS
ncbi:Vacuolar protein sorting-associated protein 26B, partial [Glycine soja]